MKNEKTLVEQLDSLRLAACQLGGSIEKTTGLIITLKKTVAKTEQRLNKHPFAKFLKK